MLIEINIYLQLSENSYKKYNIGQVRVGFASCVFRYQFLFFYFYVISSILFLFLEEHQKTFYTFFIHIIQNDTFFIHIMKTLHCVHPYTYIDRYWMTQNCRANFFN